MSGAYRFENRTFIIQDYDKQKTFASFLPGMAGKRGIPLWSFYVNRGQGITSFGLRDKNGAIQEFYPANLAYLYVSKTGFRTFVKIKGTIVEPFRPENETASRSMKIGQSEFSILETDKETGLETEVAYFGLPGEDVGALARVVSIRNISKKPILLEALDGLSQILPSGIDFGGYKAISNLLRSWMDVKNLDDQVAVYKLRSSTGDTAETKESNDGNFYVSYADGVLTRPIADMDLVFGYDTSMNTPAFFQKHSLPEILKLPQITANKVPCGFTPVSKTLKPGETTVIRTLIGYTPTIDFLFRKLEAFGKPGYFEQKRHEAQTEIDALLDDVTTKTAFPLFDEYIRQCYLDNLLRGGYPMLLGPKDKRFVYYLYSRKHGDLERDYNFFTIAPEFYSQGNGNFRDVCQNRRNDVLFTPGTGDYNIKVYASLIQADGYNPLGINGSTFEITEGAKIDKIAETCFKDHRDVMVSHLSGKFTPGSIINTMAKNKVATDLSDERLFAVIFAEARQNIEASFGEGYWVDHWTYILDLVDNYLHVFPENEKNLLYRDESYLYYDSPVSVQPRSEKTCLDKSGKVRQYGALLHPDTEKIEKCKLKENGTNWWKNPEGTPVTANLFAKLFVLALTKYATLDPEGMGVEMEANKPGWNDAMNGLPSLFASGMSETIELGRLLRFLNAKRDDKETVRLPFEVIDLARRLAKIDTLDKFQAWNDRTGFRETYRDLVRFGSRGSNAFSAMNIREILDKMETDVKDGIARALSYGNGIMPTYLYYEVDRFIAVKNLDGSPKIGRYGLPLVTAEHFILHRLPDFLEAPARFLKYNTNLEASRTMIAKLKKTDIYDEKLKMYKTSRDLDAFGYEIGRIRAFTKGWLEREANFLHMTYKYLLGILKAGEYETFFEEAKDNLVCFMDPETYGRSTLENSSFIATSNNPNPHLHGQGFVSRLTGSTAEMISIWSLMMYGKDVFSLRDGVLTLKLKPILTNGYFLNGVVQTTFLKARVTYHNMTQNASWTTEVTNYVLKKAGRTMKSVIGDCLKGKDAADVRDGLFDEIDIILK